MKTYVVLEKKEDAERVLGYLREILQRYSVTSLGDLYELVGLPVTHADNKVGWSSLKGSRIRKVKNGYSIVLPPTEVIM